MSESGLIFDVKRFSIHDGPGIRTTVFFKGCPLSCRWCHNPESISAEQVEVFHPSRCIHCGRCSEGCFSGAREILGERVSPEDLLARIERDRPFYEESGGGVTLSGGEPLLQMDFLREVLALCSSQGIHTAVDTSGYAPWETFSEILDLCDLFLFDIKHVNAVKHRSYTGVDNHLILSNFGKLISLGRDVIVRVPVAKGFNDDSVSMEEMCSYFSGIEGDFRIELVECHSYAAAKYSDLGLEAGDYQPSREAMDTFRGMLVSHGLLEG